MPDESGLWVTVRKALCSHGDLTRIENVLAEGVPDVNYALRFGHKIIEGWIELKDLDGWPARADTVVPLRHYTDAQRQWQARRLRAGGRVHVLARVRGHGVQYDEDLSIETMAVSDEFFLFPAASALVGLGVSWTRAQWNAEAHWHGKGYFAATSCIEALAR